jgi:serine protease Do
MIDVELNGMLERARRSLVQVRDGRAGAGAGILWRQDGLVLTNHHVVRHRRGQRGEHLVILSSGEKCPARLVAALPESDLALLKIDASSLPAALVADSHGLRVGQLVFALGHPWGQLNFASSGIISALGNFQTRSGELIPYIRTDVPLAPGDSGGPLLNAAGGVIGINAMIVGGDQSVSIPVHMAREFIESVLESVKFPQPAVI